MPEMETQSLLAAYLNSAWVSTITAKGQVERVLLNGVIDPF
jgi:hypothetical protein